MNVVYNSEHFYVVEYPENGGYEIVTKPLALSVYLRGSAGDAFVVAFKDACSQDASAENMDAFLENLSPLFVQPVVFH